jgi:Flp pilus assembly protein TadD
MAVDWKLFGDAMHKANSGDPMESLQIIANLEPMVESDTERAVLLSGKATCCARLGKMEESRSLILQAKALVKEDRLLRSQVELSEASHYALTGHAELACEQYGRISSEYADVLAKPEHRDFQQELLSRYGYALVHAERFTEAVATLRYALNIAEVTEVQRIRLYLGIALAAEGQAQEAQVELSAAAAGDDVELSKIALERLAGLKTAH